MTDKAETGLSGFFTRYFALLQKEFRQMMRDKSNLAIGILLPIKIGRASCRERV